ncbi:MAG: hypothetical protein MI866_08350, partial [Bacteroidales bacterium]|nr:hypothetical protein [Bacteroidales bacterium]
CISIIDLKKKKKKKVLFVLSFALISGLSSCEKENDQVKPLDQVSKIERSMWQMEDGAYIEFVPQLNEMLVYGSVSPYVEDASKLLLTPTAFSYYLQNNGTGKINSTNIKYKLQNKNLILGENSLTKIRRGNIIVPDPMKGANNKIWNEIIKGRYAAEFIGFGDTEVTISFLKNRALVIIRKDESEPVQSKRFCFKNGKLYFDNPKNEPGFILEAYNHDKVVLRPDDNSNNLMILYPIVH